MADVALTEEIKAKALEVGYCAVGVTTLEEFKEFDEKLAHREGYERFRKQLETASEIRNALPDTACVISLVDNCGDIHYPENLTPYIGRTYLAKIYGGVKPGTNAPKHEVFREWLHSRGIETIDEAGFTQVPDRPIAARAGLITFGKNNFAYAAGDQAAHAGSFIVITNIVVNADLVTENHPMHQGCPEGCRKCIDACPTHAMDDEGNLNATRCILYNNMFPDEILDLSLRDKLGVHIHGCDVCQEVCPRNAAVLSRSEGLRQDERIEELAAEFSLEGILLNGEEWFNDTVGRTISPYFKNYARHQRNAAIAMGNSGDVRYLSHLQQAREQNLGDAETQNAVAWAIERLS